MYFFFDLSTASDYAEDSAALVLRSLISEKNLWKQMINGRVILIDRKFQTVRTYFAKKVIDDGHFNELEDVLYITDHVDESNAVQVSNMMYTALKCEYAYAFGNVLTFFFRCVSACRPRSKRNPRNQSDGENEEHEEQFSCERTILTRFLDLRRYFVRAIFNLFSFEGLFANLRSSDQTLSLALITINLFMYSNHAKTKPTVLDALLGKILLQMVNLVENFKSKNCSLVFDFSLDYNPIMNQIYNYSQASTEEFYKEFRSMTDEVLQNYLIPLNNLEDIGLEGFEYSLDMYDPEFIMLNNNDFGSKCNNLSIQFSSTVKTINYILLDIQTSYDIKNVLKYQMLLINYIRSLFSLKLVGVMKTELSTENKFAILKTLSYYFKVYIDYFIPNNYPTTYFEIINNITTALDIDLNQPIIRNKNDVYFESLAKIVYRLKKDSIICQNSDNFDSIFINISMPDLIEDIKKYSKPFVQTFELLLQKSNTLDDYYLLQEHDYERLTNKNNPDDDEMCQPMENVRNSLLLLWSLIEVILRESDEELKKIKITALIEFFWTTFKHIQYVYQNVITNKKIKNILLPLLITNRQNAENIFNAQSNDSLSAVFTFKQIIIMTVTSVQNQEIVNCNPTKSQVLISDSLSINIKSIVNLSTDIEVLKLYISGVLNAITQVHNYVNRNLDNSTDHNTFNYILPNSGLDSIDVYSKNVQFYWNGNKKNVYNICQDIKLNVSDYHDLVRFQSSILKWFLSNAYTKMLYIFKFPIDLTREKIDLICNDLNQLQTNILSTTLLTHVQDTIKLYLEIFRYNDISHESITDFESAVSYRLKLYGVIIETHQFETLDDCYRSLKNDIEAIEKHFSKDDNELLINYKDDFSIPMLWEE